MSMNAIQRESSRWRSMQSSYACTWPGKAGQSVSSTVPSST